MKCLRFSQYSALLLISLASVTAAWAKDTSPNAAITPTARTQDTWWMDRHEKFNAVAKKGGVDIIFVGDSITQGWEDAGKDVWQTFYAKRHAANSGINGDKTYNVLWRLDHGNIDGISPKLAVIMIGTNNNANGFKPADTALGIKTIIEKLKVKLPHTKILLLAIFPRGADNSDPVRALNTKTNEVIVKLADNKTVFYLDIGPKFIKADGTLSTEIMPDLLHLSPRGYTIWAEAIEPTVAKLMGEK